jgi:hypothetical protein
MEQEFEVVEKFNNGRGGWLATHKPSNISEFSSDRDTAIFELGVEVGRERGIADELLWRNCAKS